MNINIMTPTTTIASSTPTFSSDLIGSAKHHIEFLRFVHEHETIINASSTTSTAPAVEVESLRRYRDLWLPLVYEHPEQLLIPPVDVAWLWHCHRLAPYRYTTYCKKRFGVTTPVEANPPFTAVAASSLPSVLDDATPAKGDRDYDAEDVSFLDGGIPTVNDETVTLTIDLWNKKYPNESFYRSTNKKEKKMSGIAAVNCNGNKNKSLCYLMDLIC